MSCTLCPRGCGVDRGSGRGYCGEGAAIRVAKTAFRFLNVRFEPETDLICSLKTNEVPVRSDPEIPGQVEKTVAHLLKEDANGVQD